MISFPIQGILEVLGPAAAATFLASAAILWGQRRLGGAFTRMSDSIAVQCMHLRPTPRVGGLAILLGLAFGATVSGGPAQGLWGPLLVAAVPVLLAGIVEDSGKGVQPAGRLLAAVLSGAVAVVLFGDWLRGLDVPGLDLAMAWSPFAIAFTLLCVAGVCHAVNLVDGLNGLAGALAVAIAMGLAAIAAAEGLPDIARVAYIVVGATVGFLILNYPAGRLFLGDAGAYGLGFLLVWLGILIVARVDAVTAWALLLVFFWPIADTVLAIWRRLRKGRPVGQPDRLHYHQLVLRALEILLLGKNRRHIANPLATLLLIPLFSAPILAGVLLRNDPLAAALASLGFGAAFFASYAAGLRVAAAAGRRRLPLWSQGGAVHPRGGRA